MSGMKTGHWHTIGFLEPHSYVHDCLSTERAVEGYWKPLWKLVYSSDRLIIIRNVFSGYFNVLVDKGHGDDKWALMIPANITTLRRWLSERVSPEYARDILRNK